MSTSPSMLEVLGMNSRGLIHALEESFPPTNPTPEDSMEKIMYRSGQRSVVEWVIKYMEDNNGLKTEQKGKKTSCKKNSKKD